MRRSVRVDRAVSNVPVLRCLRRASSSDLTDALQAFMRIFLYAFRLRIFDDFRLVSFAVIKSAPFPALSLHHKIRKKENAHIHIPATRTGKSVPGCIMKRSAEAAGRAFINPRRYYRYLYTPGRFSGVFTRPCKTCDRKALKQKSEYKKERVLGWFS